MKIMTDQFFTKLDCKVIKEQVARRAKCREEFLKARTDPCKHSQEAGYVFDPAIQRYLSMKNCQYDQFQANPRTSLFGLAALAPMFLMAYGIWYQRTEREKKIRSGKFKYRDRSFKLQ